MNIQLSVLVLIGAYGRETNIDDWNAGKDFKIVRGPYCSIRDMQEMAESFDAIQFVALDGKLLGIIPLNEFAASVIYSAQLVSIEPAPSQQTLH